jgi:hypothetical protein
MPAHHEQRRRSEEESGGDLQRGRGLLRPSDQYLSKVESLRSLLTGAGLTNVEVVAEMSAQEISSLDDWWAKIMGSGYRGTKPTSSTDSPPFNPRI